MKMTWIKLIDKCPTAEEVGEKVLMYRIMNDSQEKQAITIHETRMIKYCNPEETWWMRLPCAPSKPSKLIDDYFKSESILQVNDSLPGYVKIKDECYIEDCFDNDDKPIDGRFTEIYLKIDEVKNGGKLKER